MSCNNNLKNLALAFHNHHDTYGEFPAGADDTGTASRQMWGWGAHLLPFIEQNSLYDQMGVSRQGLVQVLDDAALRPLTQTALTAFICPSDPGGHLMDGGTMNGGRGRHFNGEADIGNNFRVAKSNYIGVCGMFDVDMRKNNGVLHRGSDHRFADVEDGTSNTFLLGERNRRCAQGAWVGNRNVTGGGPQGCDYTIGRVTRPLNSPNNGGHHCPEAFASEHPGGALFAFVDGSVQFIADTIHYRNAGVNGNNQNANTNPPNFNAANLGTYQRLGTRNDGQPVSEF